MTETKDRLPINIYQHLREDVIDTGLCTHCGTCAGLSNSSIAMVRGERGPLPIPQRDAPPELPELALHTCPGLGINYPELFHWLFESLPENWLIGVVRGMFLGYSLIPRIRRAGSSGGVITQSLLYLLNKNLIDGAIVLKHGEPEPWLSTPIIAQSVEQIEAAAQSVYVPIPTNTILAEIDSFSGRLAYVGLPDQVAAIRRLQYLGHSGARKIEYIIGPYVGTLMYLESIRSYLRSHNEMTMDGVKELRYREGEWPGYLQIKLKNGSILREKKFYYNYLIPFYLSASSLLSVDFTNELTDISVGDAWNPQLEKKGEGFSVILARTQQGLQLINNMKDDGLLALTDTSPETVLAMHGHMLDFKKRGTFIRLKWLQRFGRPIPEFGYAPMDIPIRRRFVEVFISGMIVIGHTRCARFIVEHLPLRIIGPIFGGLRRAWKRISKPTKRSGLLSMKYQICPSEGNQDND